jgi:hypothetical protein
VDQLPIKKCHAYGIYWNLTMISNKLSSRWDFIDLPQRDGSLVARKNIAISSAGGTTVIFIRLVWLKLILQ